MTPLRSTALARLRARRAIHVGSTHQTLWLFDLDNTLHDCSKGIFGAIDTAMANAVATTLNVGLAQANVVRKRYWQRYGATVIGMVRHHGVNPHRFLEQSHNFQVSSLVHGEYGLGRQIHRLKGRKVLLTNAPLKYARQVLASLGILHFFDGIWAIDHMHLQGTMKPKPSMALMRQVLAELGVAPGQVVLVEDTLRNLKSARHARMRTVHMYHPATPFSAAHKGRNHYVDLRVNSVRQLAQRQHRVLHTPGRQGRA
jgi:putative hydrolase of the HAD superfamily